MAYVSQSKNKNGILIIDKDKRYFTSWKDLDLLKKGEYKYKDKPIIVLKNMKDVSDATE